MLMIRRIDFGMCIEEASQEKMFPIMRKIFMSQVSSLEKGRLEGICHHASLSIIARSTDIIDFTGKIDFFYGHLIFGKRAGLIRTNDIDTTECLDRC